VKIMVGCQDRRLFGTQAAVAFTRLPDDMMQCVGVGIYVRTAGFSGFVGLCICLLVQIFTTYQRNCPNVSHLVQHDSTDSLVQKTVFE
jgi:hypothetical protein